MWRIIRRNRTDQRESVLGYADNESGAIDATPRDDRLFVHRYESVAEPGDVYAAMDIDRDVEVRVHGTRFVYRGTIVSWTDAGLVLDRGVLGPKIFREDAYGDITVVSVVGQTA